MNDLKRNNEQYREDTYAATGSKKRVIGRIMAVYNMLADITGGYGVSEDRTFSDSVKRQLFHEGYICSYCGNEIKDIADAEVDHIIPFSQGGKTEISNAQLLHRHCNRAKSDSMNALDADFEDEED